MFICSNSSSRYNWTRREKSTENACGLRKYFRAFPLEFCCSNLRCDDNECDTAQRRTQTGRANILAFGKRTERARENVFHVEQKQSAQLIRLFCCEPSNQPVKKKEKPCSAWMLPSYTFLLPFYFLKHKTEANKCRRGRKQSKSLVFVTNR